MAARTLAQVVAALDARTPFGAAADWDPVGLVQGDPAQAVQRIGWCHEVSEAVVGALTDRPVDVLVAYHPLLFEPVRSLVAGPTPEGRALRLAEAGVSLVVVHTALDVAKDGVADALAESLDLEDVTELESEDLAAGRIGLSPGTLLSELAQRAADVLEVEAPRVAGDPNRELASVAVVPGSGSDFIPAAIAAGADALVTGDVSHHKARAARDQGLAILDPGHIPTERPGVERFFSFIASMGLEAVSFLDLDPDPWE